MCMDFLKRKPPEEFNPVHFRIISNGRNKYAGSNSLNGCVNDTRFMPEPLAACMPIDVRRYYDYDVTVDKYLERGEKAIASLSSGATVCVVADSCFSGTITRGNLANGIVGDYYKIKNRYMPNPKIGAEIVRRKRIIEAVEDRCILISGSQENQTSADAYFRNYDRYMGALSCALMEAFKNGMTWGEWAFEATRLIIRWGFEQRPNILGKPERINEIIGSNQSLILHNSSHGSKIIDKSGDEADGYDETLYFDTHLSDDRISLMLDKIPA